MSAPTGPGVRLGAVAYDPKVVTIWDGFRGWLVEHSLAFDYVLYSNYEAQVEDLLAGNIDVAWNSPLAWLHAERAAVEGGPGVSARLMRDSDRDLTSIIVVADDSEISTVKGLCGKVIGTGAVDSPQATLLPLDLLRDHGLDPASDMVVRHHDVGVGLHGDHIGGEREAARSLAAGDVDAVCMLSANHLLFAREGTLDAAGTRVLAETAKFDHCNMTVNDDVASPDAVDRFSALLLSMDYRDASVRRLLDLEGLKRWVPGRLDGYAPLRRAVDRSHL